MLMDLRGKTGGREGGNEVRGVEEVEVRGCVEEEE